MIFGLALVSMFVMEMDGFGQSELSSANTVDLRSVVPILYVVCGLVTFSTYC